LDDGFFLHQYFFVKRFDQKELDWRNYIVVDSDYDVVSVIIKRALNMKALFKL